MVEIHTGDKVPADIRVVQLKTAVVRVEQAALTGESVAVAKSAAPVDSVECELQVGSVGARGDATAGCCMAHFGRPTSLARSLRPSCSPSLPPRSQLKSNMLFAGTGIASGACLGVVNTIGMHTGAWGKQQGVGLSECPRACTPARTCCRWRN